MHVHNGKRGDCFVLDAESQKSNRSEIIDEERIKSSLYVRLLNVLQKCRREGCMQVPALVSFIATDATMIQPQPG